MAIPKRIADRINSGLKRLRPIIEQQRSKDVSEADTVTIVKEVLNEILGYDKFSEVTGEYSIRGTFCDLAIKLNDKVTELIEIKAIGITLDDRHLKQAVNYAANEGIEWVILTNGATWRFYNVLFSKPIDKRLIFEINLLDCNPAEESVLEQLYALSKEGFLKGIHVSLRDVQNATSRYVLAALLLHNRRVSNTLRRELRRVVSVNVDLANILDVLRNEVIKRDALEDPEAEKAIEAVKGARGQRIRSGRKPKRTKSSTNRSSTTVHDLIAAGVIRPPVEIRRRYKGQSLDAVIQPDGMIVWNGQSFDNLSSAASAARQLVLGREVRTNGWAFWRIATADGERRTVSELREEFDNERASSG